MPDDPILASTLQALDQFHPKSVFLYGSRGRGDARPESDYEVGVIFDDDKYVQRKDIHAAVANPQVKAYPYKGGELSSGTFDNPFQRSIYLREIITGGQSIAGEHLIEQIPPPPITTLDLAQDIRFYIGRALDALLVSRDGHTELGLEMFSKSCLFGLRCLEILEIKTFPKGYEEIYTLSGKVVTEPGYRAVIEAAYGVRQGKTDVAIDMLFENISLLNKLIEGRIVAVLKAQGIQEVI